jgi:hypothetical protein
MGVLLKMLKHSTSIYRVLDVDVKYKQNLKASIEAFKFLR